MRTHSLRTRLVATMLLLLAVAAVVVGVVTTLLLRRELTDRLDYELQRSSPLIARFDPTQPDAFPGGPPGDGGNGGGGGGRLGYPPPVDGLLAKIANGQVTGGWTISRGPVESPGSVVTALPTSEYADLAAVAVDGRSRSVDVSGENYLVRAVAVSDGVLVTGISEKDVEFTLARLVTAELAVAAATLVLAGIAGAVLVRRELRPLERVAVTATRVSDLKLDSGEVDLTERVPDADPRTEVGQVGAALNRMLDHVGGALEARQASETQLRQFVADASHELRTPLAAIRGYAELTRRSPQSEETAYSLTRISSQAERMTTLVEDLLLLARLDAGRPLERGEVDLTRLVLDAVSDAHAAGPDHHWRLSLPDEPVTAPGDASRLAQVLANLLANARTHTPAGTSVTIELTAPSGAARISVMDEGPGIPPELLPHVFERFARGSTSRSRENGSTGLGLAIVDAVVAAHHGSVEVTSRPGRTEFAVIVPTTPAVAVTAPIRRPARART